LVFWQAPWLQVSVVQSLPSSQLLPQVPQLLGSLARSTQAPLQQPGVVPSVQTLPQAPQLLTSNARSAQAPLQQSGVVLPAVQSLPQVPQLLTSDARSVQLKLQQAGVVPASQAVLQLPQLRVVLRGVSQPGAPVQSPKPVLHSKLQLPFVQAKAAFGTLQDLPQAPQFATSVLRFVSQPSVVMVLQWQKGAVQRQRRGLPEQVEFGGQMVAAVHAVLPAGVLLPPVQDPCASTRGTFSAPPIPAAKPAVMSLIAVRRDLAPAKSRAI
jgi:hypothetical protein